MIVECVTQPTSSASLFPETGNVPQLAHPFPTLSMYNQNEKVEKVNVAEEMSKSFLDYSMSVIISRALPMRATG